MARETIYTCDRCGAALLGTEVGSHPLMEVRVERNVKPGYYGNGDTLRKMDLCPSCSKPIEDAFEIVEAEVDMGETMGGKKITITPAEKEHPDRSHEHDMDRRSGVPWRCKNCVKPDDSDISDKTDTIGCVAPESLYDAFVEFEQAVIIAVHAGVPKSRMIEFVDNETKG